MEMKSIHVHHRARRVVRNGVQHLEARQVLAASPLAITEIMYHPRITPAEETAGFRENDFEFVEVENTTSQTMNLAGYRFTAGIEFVFGNYAIGPRQQAVIARNPEALRFRHGEEMLIVGQYSGSISNNNERFTLVGPSGSTLLDFEMDDGWYPQTDGAGYSLTIVDPLADSSAWNSGSSWRASLALDGSPGQADGETGSGLSLAPQQLVAQAESVRHVSLRWQAPPESGRPIVAYQVYRDGQSIGSTRDTQFLDATASPSSTHVYQVSTVDNLQTEIALSRAVVVELETVGGKPTFASEVDLGNVVSTSLTEISGLISGRTNPDHLWLVDDHTGPNQVYAIDQNGRFVGVVTLSGVQSIDWEDIAVGPGPQANQSYLYVGDIGDNTSSRNSIIVYRFAEMRLNLANPDRPFVLDSSQYEAIVMQYPGGPRDAETLLVDPTSGDLFIATKEGNKSRIFRAPAASLRAGTTVLLEDVGGVELSNPAGGDISPNGQEIILRNEQRALLYTRIPGESIADALARPGLEVPVVGTPTEPNGEALTFAANNRGYFTISEGENPTLYFFLRTGPSPAGDSNRDGVFSSADLVRVFQLGEYDTGEPATWEEGDWNGDGLFDSSDLVWAFQNGGYEDM